MHAAAGRLAFSPLHSGLYHKRWKWYTFFMEPKRLYKSDSNRVLAGVFGGLGEYFNIDPVLLRVIWIFVVIFTAFVPGIITYILAAIVIPKRPVHIHHQTHTQHE